jgi:hypothetical protein
MPSSLDDFLQQQEDDQDVTPEPTDNKTEVKEDGAGETDDADKKETTEDKAEEKEDSATEEDTTAADADAAVPPDNTELNELRQFIREQRKEIAAMQAKLSRVKETGEVDDEGNTTVSYTPLEKLQIELHNVAVKRGDALTDMVELMEINPKFEDVKEVCTKTHFDDIFEMAATAISRKEGRDFNETLLQLELEVWKMPNPYKYMYSLIKENHPKFKAKETPKADVKEKIKDALNPADTAKKILEAKQAPGSVAARGAGDNLGTGAWTAAKIDDLDESELHQVPKDIYQKYMMGKLK